MLQKPEISKFILKTSSIFVNISYSSLFEKLEEIEGLSTLEKVHKDIHIENKTKLLSRTRTKIKNKSTTKKTIRKMKRRQM